MRAESIYGVMSTGGVEVALPAAELQEVVGWPERLLPEPGAPAHARGMFKLRGFAVPMLDLRCLMTGAAPATGGMVAILGTPSGRLGLAVDGIADVVRVEPTQVQRLNYQDTANLRPLWSSVLTLSGGDRMIRVLDSATLTGQHGVAPLPAVEGARETVSDRRERLHVLVVRACGRLFGFGVGTVRELVVEPRLETFTIQCSLLEGMLRRQGRLVPVINLGCLLGLPESDSPCGTVLVLQVDGWQVGFPIRAVAAMPHYTQASLTVFEGLMLRRSPLFRGLLPPPDSSDAEAGHEESPILLDHAALFRHPDIGAVCRLLRGLQQAEEDVSRSAPRGTRVQMLLFAVGAERFYIPLAEVQEIAQLPARHFRFGNSGSELLGAMPSGGAMVPLVSLRVLMGQPMQDRDADTRVLLVRGTETTFGFVVDRTEAIERVVIRNDITLDAGHLAEGASLIQAVTRRVPFETKAGHQPLPVLDLRELARRMDAEAVGKRA